MPARKTILLAALLGAATFVFASATTDPNESTPTAPLDLRAVALQSWQQHLQLIGWPQDLSERYAPRLLGKQQAPVANEHGGNTVVFDGSKPGVLATVTLTLDARGQLVGKPEVMLGDVLEAR